MFRSRRYESASALISTLLAVVVLTIIVTAFLQSMSVERKTARSYRNILQADLATSAGRAHALELLANTGTRTDDYSVVQTNYTSSINAAPPTYFISKRTSAGTVEYVPLVSGANRQIPPQPPGVLPDQALISSPDFPDSAEIDLPSYQTDYYSNQNPSVRWVPIDNADGDEVGRFAYWIEDLQGHLDLKVAGNLKNAGKHVRAETLGDVDARSDAALYSLFDRKARSDDGQSEAKDVLEDRAIILTPATTLQVVNETDASLAESKDPRLHLYPGLGFETEERAVIPTGFGFVNEGEPKISLNDSISGSDAVNTISSAISTNLPDFATVRSGGMAPTTYLQNLAANMVDYADSDGQTTTDGSTYRGIDSFPFVTQWFMMTAYTGRSPSSATFTIRHFVEIWNPSDKTAEGTMRFEGRSGYIGSVGGTVLNFGTPGDNVTETTVLNPQDVSLGPNQKQIFEAASSTYVVTTSSAPGSRVSVPETRTGKYMAFWRDLAGGGDFLLVDKPGASVFGYNSAFDYSADAAPNNNTDWNAAIPGLIYKPDNGSGYINGNPGDPRAAYYIRAAQDESAYHTRAVVGGRTIRQGLQGKTYGEVKPSYWADPGFDDAPGRFVGNGNTIPTSVQPTASNPRYAPSHIANYPDSNYRSITELGHLYDPALWQQYPGQESQTNLDSSVKTKLSKIDSSSSPGSGHFGGGLSLRIGKKEFERFDTPFADRFTARAKATDLLGIFATEETRSTKGLVNINTATREVLRSLGAGIQMNRPEYTRTATSEPYNAESNPATIYGPTTAVNSTDREDGDVFADAVIANRPFYSEHELAGRLLAPPISASAEFIWGNPASWKNPADRPTVWRDAEAEEYLRQIYDLTTVRSRNFRIHIIGQAVNSDGIPVATQRSTVDVFLEPVRDPATSEISSLQTRTLYESD